MQRRKRGALLERGHNVVIDLHGAGKLLTAMDDTVTDSVDLIHGGDNAVLGAGELLDDSGDRFGMRGHGDVLVKNGLITAERSVLQMTVNADTLAKAFRENLFRLHIDELILQRRAARIDYKNFPDADSFP